MDRLVVEKPAQVVRQILSGGVTVTGALANCLENDGLQFGRDRPVDRARLARIFDGNPPPDPYEEDIWAEDAGFEAVPPEEGGS